MIEKLIFLNALISNKNADKLSFIDLWSSWVISGKTNDKKIYYGQKLSIRFSLTVDIKYKIFLENEKCFQNSFKIWFIKIYGLLIFSQVF